MLDLTSAVRSAPELVIELRVRGGNVELVLAPGMVVEANELSVWHSQLTIGRDAGDNTPETLRVRLVGRMRHGRSTPGGRRRAGDAAESRYCGNQGLRHHAPLIITVNGPSKSRPRPPRPYAPRRPPRKIEH
ncbi:hypothetical protein FHR32_007148 [Streptosporangium album]|uniref:Uncharacterized protein n=1 Tax=Streptosporangium album TaxID=47479 RepID=A0A7W7WDF0_9ACTN|nr:hypothetical protein [Streptosporangium album]MBB4942748.1 hypothetical protein [Streptosporangium album]